MQSNKIQYNSLCETAGLPLQMQPWWLDAVCGTENWDVILSQTGNNEIVGALPYFQTKKLGLRLINMPPFTTYGGPWLKSNPTNYAKRTALYGYQKRTIRDLMRQLPPTFFYINHCPPTFQNGLPFHWSGFRQSVRYTYLIPPGLPEKEIYGGFKKTVRADIRKAAKTIDVIESDDPKTVFELNRQTLQLKNLPFEYDFGIFEKLDAALAQRGNRKIFVGLDKIDGSVIAALYVAFDEKSAHCLLSGTNPETKSIDAIYLLFWEAIKELSPTRTFDFEGSMIPEIEHFIRYFGGIQTPYLRISRAKNRLAETFLTLIGKI